MYKISALVVVLLSLNSWAYRPISNERRQELLKQFVYTPQTNIIKISKATGCSAQDLVYTTTYPERETPYQINAKAYIPNQSNAPVVFMLPPLGGSNPLDTAMAQNLCRNNIAAILILNDFTGLSSNTLMPVEDHDHTVRRVASAIKGGLLVVRAFPEINTDKAGIFGASLGGILGSMAYGVLPEISAASFIVNGGDVPHILATSDQEPVIRVKRARMAEVGLKTDEEYEAYLDEHLSFDPLHFAPLIPPESIKLYLSKADHSVPSQDQMAFYNAVGSPHNVSFYSLSHAMTIFAVLGIGGEKQNISKWFLDRFSQANPRTVF